MKYLFFILVFVLPVWGLNAEPPAVKDPEIAFAKTAIAQFSNALQTELKAALQAGGPLAAIGICHTRAMPITQQLADEYGVQLSRVSLKNRNPANAPTAWQLAVLEDFERRNLAGEDRGKLSWSETVDVGDGREFRFMKAIPTGEVCLQCHGSQLAPEISKLLGSLYPEDQATGYKIGDIRGAFVFIRKLADP